MLLIFSLTNTKKYLCLRFENAYNLHITAYFRLAIVIPVRIFRLLEIQSERNHCYQMYQQVQAYDAL